MTAPDPCPATTILTAGALVLASSLRSRRTSPCVVNIATSDFGDYHFAGVNTGLSVQRHQGVVAVIGKF
jgi:hypothetical protein